MKSYTTISVKPQLKAKINRLKGGKTYTEYLNKKIEEEWEESDYNEDNLDVEEIQQ